MYNISDSGGGVNIPPLLPIVLTYPFSENCILTSQIRQGGVGSHNSPSSISDVVTQVL